MYECVRVSVRVRVRVSVRVCVCVSVRVRVCECMYRVGGCGRGVQKLDENSAFQWFLLYSSVELLSFNFIVLYRFDILSFTFFIFCKAWYCIPSHSNLN